MNPPKFYLKLKGLAKQNVGWSLRPKTLKKFFLLINCSLIFAGSGSEKKFRIRIQERFPDPIGSGFTTLGS